MSLQTFEWVSASNKLPDIITSERHLLVFCCGDVFPAFWNKKSNKFLDESMGMGLVGVTHWAEFPAPPKLPRRTSYELEGNQ